jgi:hypothetical protein
MKARSAAAAAVAAGAGESGHLTTVSLRMPHSRQMTAWPSLPRSAAISSCRAAMLTPST